jgi:hypothetical protein
VNKTVVCPLFLLVKKHAAAEKLKARYTLDIMNAPIHSLRLVFALSTFACSVILVLFFHGRAQWTPEFWFQLFATSVAISGAVCFVAFRKRKMRVEGVPLARFAGVFFRHLLLTYVASAIVLTVIAWVFIYLVTRTAPNALALAVLAGLWLSLWLAPAIASISCWRRLQSTSGHASDS